MYVRHSHGCLHSLLTALILFFPSFFFFSCPSLCRRWLGRGSSVSPRLGHALLDQLHYLNHRPPHGGPGAARGVHAGHRGHHVQRRPPASVCAGRVSEVSTADHSGTSLLSDLRPFCRLHIDPKTYPSLLLVGSMYTFGSWVLD